MDGVDALMGVTIFRRGDTVVHRNTGRTYVVDYVHVNKHRLKIVTPEGTMFNEYDVSKVQPERELGF